jgi:hypothetical protein
MIGSQYLLVVGVNCRQSFQPLLPFLLIYRWDRLPLQIYQPGKS